MENISSYYCTDDDEEVEDEPQEKQMILLDLTSIASDSEDAEPTSTDQHAAEHADDDDMECDVFSSPAISTLPANSTTTAPSSSTPLRKYALSEDLLPSGMITFLQEMRSYFLKPVNLERQKAPIAASTMGKAEERILCYLGFVQNRLSLGLTPEVFLRVPVIEKYITYLQEERCLSAATISNHAAAMLYPAKFLHGDSAPEYHGIKVIKQLRAQVAFHQRKSNTERPSSKEDLEAMNRWLDWSEVLKCVGFQRERMEIAKSPVGKATECANLLLLAIYTLMPPSRGLEIRTLELVPEPLTITSPALGKKNLVAVDDVGGVTFRFQNYKTVATYGADTTTLKPSHEISIILKEYLRTHRSKLVNEASGNFLLVNKVGKPFSSPAFSSHLKFLFYRLSGVHLSVNTLRSSFLTHAYSLSDITDATKDSLAAALRHSRKHAQETYDKRTANERKGLAISMAMEFAQNGDGGNDVDQNRGLYKVGDFVGLIEEDSTLVEPKVMIAQIQSLQPDNQANLLWYDMTDRKDEYIFQFEPQPWVESIHALYPIDMRPMKKRKGIYKLYTNPKTIHKALSGTRLG